MKINILLFWSLLSSGLITAQTNTKKQYAGFSNFLNHFYSVELPINYKKEVEKITKGEIKLKEMSKLEATQFLLKREKDLFYYEEEYNYDLDEKKKVKVENLPAYQFKNLADNYILVCVRELKGLNGDTSIISLYTFNFNGEFVDVLKIEEQTTPERDWASFIMTTDGMIKVYKYQLNKANYDIVKNTIKLKDKTKPKTTLIIEDIKVDQYGKFTRITEYPIQFLKDDIQNYKTYKPKNDDPMNLTN